MELADSQREIATKDIQEAVDNAGMSGHVKIFYNARKQSGMNTPPWLDDEIHNKMLNLKRLSRTFVY